MSAPCEICDGEGFVCITHPDLAFDSWHQTICGEGMPCVCNPAHEDHLSQSEKQKLKEYDEEQEFINKFKKGG